MGVLKLFFKTGSCDLIKIFTIKIAPKRDYFLPVDLESVEVKSVFLCTKRTIVLSFINECSLIRCEGQWIHWERCPFCFVYAYRGQLHFYSIYEGVVKYI